MPVNFGFKTDNKQGDCRIKVTAPLHLINLTLRLKRVRSFPS